MTLPLSPARPPALPAGAVGRPDHLPWSGRARGRVVGRTVVEFWRSDRVVRLAPVGAIACSGLLPVLQVVLAFAYLDNNLRTGLWSLAATALYLPLHLRHVWYAAHATRPPHRHWTLAAMAVVILAATPVAGTMWPRAYVGLAVSAVLLLPAPWSLAIYATLVAIAAPVSLLMGVPWTVVPWLMFSVLTGSWALLLLVWLSAALTRLQAAREVLAQQAVAQERRRIDDDLRRTLGSALESIAARGERVGQRLAESEREGRRAVGSQSVGSRSAGSQSAGSQSTGPQPAGEEPAALVDELMALADDSRRTLAEARQRVRGYRQPSLRAELETAATLLSAAGIETRLVLPRSGLPATIAQHPRAALRATVTRLLRTNGVRACTITTTVSNGRALLELRTDNTTETIEVIPGPQAGPTTDPTEVWP
ncbi:hypothetical protein [Nonomuraea rhizosphaerae]|uniref:hypothetical protein n=1 Tax=Nonomuraea rhizosphaerae TaxID=2665663 RepID=UPI001C5CF8A3|nr:hypothetical protein [Nonomuraea rhizosphaerae]